MIVVKGNKKIELSKEEFNNILDKYASVEVDIGTGDGRFVHKNALKNKNTLFIGLDPSDKQLEIYSKKTLKKKLDNTLFVIGSIENTPEELVEIGNKIHITLPWGTLLEKVIKPTEEFICTLKNMLKTHGKLELIFGYVPELEPSEAKRLNLPDVDDVYIKRELLPMFEKFNFKLDKINELSRKDIGELETTWAKRLKFGKNRKIYILSFSRVD